MLSDGCYFHQAYKSEIAGHILTLVRACSKTGGSLLLTDGDSVAEEREPFGSH